MAWRPTRPSCWCASLRHERLRLGRGGGARAQLRLQRLTCFPERAAFCMVTAAAQWASHPSLLVTSSGTTHAAHAIVGPLATLAMACCLYIVLGAQESPSSP